MKANKGYITFVDENGRHAALRTHSEFSDSEDDEDRGQGVAALAAPPPGQRLYDAGRHRKQHKLFTTHELLRQVLEELDSRELVVNLTVCWFWLGVIAPLVWFHFDPHFKFMSGRRDALGIFRRLTTTTLDLDDLDDIPSYGELKRFPIYAQSIRRIRLDLFEDGDGGFSDRLCAGPAPFDDLRAVEIRIRSPSANQKQAFLHILNPNIQEVAIRLPRLASDGAVAAVLRDFAAAVRETKVHALQKLVVAGDPDQELSSAGVREIGEVIESTRCVHNLQLQRFRVQGFQPVFVAAGGSPVLFQLSLMDVRISAPLEADLKDGPALPALVRLNVDGDPQTVRTICSSFNIETLEELDIGIRSEEAGIRGHDWSCSHFTCLRLIKLLIATTETSWNDVIEQIVQLALLEDVDISGRLAYVEVTNDHISLMAQAWPRLQSLWLTDDSQPVTWDDFMAAQVRGARWMAPAVTLQGLECLAIHCPFLQKLSVSVNAMQRWDTRHQTKVGSRVRWLHLKFSICISPCFETAATFIHRMWPNALLNDDFASWGRTWTGEQVEGELDKMQKGQKLAWKFIRDRVSIFRFPSRAAFSGDWNLPNSSFS